MLLEHLCPGAGWVYIRWRYNACTKRKNPRRTRWIRSKIPEIRGIAEWDFYSSSSLELYSMCTSQGSVLYTAWSEGQVSNLRGVPDACNVCVYLTLMAPDKTPPSESSPVCSGLIEPVKRTAGRLPPAAWRYIYSPESSHLSPVAALVAALICPTCDRS